MVIRRLALLSALVALVALGVGAASSSAASYLHDNATTGSLLTAGTTIMPRSSDPAVLTLPGIGAVTCTSNTFDATVGASGGASISGTLHSLTLSSCTDTIPVLTISSCNSANSAALTITAMGDSGGTVASGDITIFCVANESSYGCYYTMATTAGVARNSGASLSFSNISITHTTGPGDLGAICGNTASFYTTFTDLTSGGTGRTVVLNTTS